MVLILAAETVLEVWGDKLKMNALKNAFRIATVYPAYLRIQHYGRFHQALEFHFLKHTSSVSLT